MKLNLSICLLCGGLVLCDAIFPFLTERLFCQICPTYCPARHHKKRRDVDTSFYSSHGDLHGTEQTKHTHEELNQKSNGYNDFYKYEDTGNNLQTVPESHYDWRNVPQPPDEHAAYKDSVKKYQNWDHSENKPYEYLYEAHLKHPWPYGHGYETQHKHPLSYGHGYETQHKHPLSYGQEYETHHKHPPSYGHEYERNHKHPPSYGHEYETHHIHPSSYGHEHETHHIHPSSYGHEYETHHKHPPSYGHEYETHHKHPWAYDQGHETHYKHPLNAQGYEVEYNVKYAFKPITTTSATITTTVKPDTTTKASTKTEELSGICIFCMNRCH